MFPRAVNWRAAAGVWLVIMLFDAAMIYWDPRGWFFFFYLWFLVNLPGLPLVFILVAVAPRFSPPGNSVHILIGISLLSATVWSMLSGYVFRHKEAT